MRGTGASSLFIAGMSRSKRISVPRCPRATNRSALSVKWRYSTGLVTPASAAMWSMPTSGPCSASARIAASTNSARRAARWERQRSRLASPSGLCS